MKNSGRRRYREIDNRRPHQQQLQPHSQQLQLQGLHAQPHNSTSNKIKQHTTLYKNFQQYTTRYHKVQLHTTTYNDHHHHRDNDPHRRHYQNQEPHQPHQPRQQKPTTKTWTHGSKKFKDFKSVRPSLDMSQEHTGTNKLKWSFLAMPRSCGWGDSSKTLTILETQTPKTRQGFIDSVTPFREIFQRKAWKTVFFCFSGGEKRDATN